MNLGQSRRQVSRTSPPLTPSHTYSTYSISEQDRSTSQLILVHQSHERPPRRRQGDLNFLQQFDDVEGAMGDKAYGLLKDMITTSTHVVWDGVEGTLADIILDTVADRMAGIIKRKRRGSSLPHPPSPSSTLEVPSRRDHEEVR